MTRLMRTVATCDASDASRVQGSSIMIGSSRILTTVAAASNENIMEDWLANRLSEIEQRLVLLR